MAKVEDFPKKTPRAKGIPRELRDESRLLPLSDPRSPITERYRRLKTHVEHIGEREGRPTRVIVVSSSREGEGKTLTAANLALVLAEERDRSVVLVDCDLHRPQVHKILHHPPRIGLVDVYQGKADLDAALVPLVKSRLQILPAGNVEACNPAEVFRSDRFRKLVAELKERFHRVVFDTPPIMRFVDANVLNEFSDGMVFVVRAGLTSRQMVRKAVTSVTSGRILGLVFNDARFTIVDRYYYRYDEYGYGIYDE